MRDLDISLFRAINNWPESWASFFVPLSELTKWTGGRISLLALTAAMLWHKPTRAATVYALFSVPLANETTDIIKAGLPMARPCVDLADVNLHVKLLTSNGTASAHSANMMAVAFAMTYVAGWKWGLPWIIVAVLTGISRIYNGVHYPSQVLFGWTVGCLAAFAVIQAGRWIQRLRGAGSEGAEPAPDGPASQSADPQP